MNFFIKGLLLLIQVASRVYLRNSRQSTLTNQIAGIEKVLARLLSDQYISKDLLTHSIGLVFGPCQTDNARHLIVRKVLSLY
jgi:hypothetical protein